MHTTARQARDLLSQLIQTLSARLPLVQDQGNVVRAVPVPVTFPEITPEDCLHIPEHEQDVDDTASRKAQLRGQFLARQDRWDDLAAEIRAADVERLKTPCGTPISELLAFGARADVVNAVEHALSEGHAADSRLLIDGIMALETVRLQDRADPYLATLVALAHIDIAWIWRGTGWDSTVPKMNRARCTAHFDRAAALLSPFDTPNLASPFVAAATCALPPKSPGETQALANRYQQLIDLDPDNSRHMRALGNHMLPRWYGSYDALELEARRTAARTQAQWGAGAYAWVYFDAMAHDENACARVDVDFFLEGLRDIASNDPSQETINLLAAFCSVALRNGMGVNDEADMVRSKIAAANTWLIRDHLRELHPMIWAHAANGFDNNTRVTSPRRFADRGRADALQIICSLFHEEISGGHRVKFTADGPRVEPA